MKQKQKCMKRLQKSLTWLLLLGTLLTAVAGNTLPVSAAETNQESTETVEYKYKMSYAFRRVFNNFEHIEASASLESNFQLFLYGDIPVPATSGVYQLGYVDSLGVCRAAVSYSADFIPNTRTGNGIYFSAFHWARIQSSNGVVNAERNGPFPDSLMNSSMFDALRTFTLNTVKGDEYSCAGYVFKSLETAQAYFDSGDTSGLVQEPVIPPADDDTDDGWLQDLIDKLKEWEDGAFGPLVAPFIAFGEGLQNIKNAILNLLPERIRDVLSGFFDVTEGLARDTFGMVRQISWFLEAKAEEFVSLLTDLHYELVKISEGIWRFSWDLLPDAIKDKLQPFLEGISGLLEKVRDAVDSLGRKFTDLIPSINDIKDAIKNSRIGSYLSDLKEMFASFPGLSAAIKTFLDDPLACIKKAIAADFEYSPFNLLFVPSEKFMEKLAVDLHEDFSGIFSIIDEVKKVINYMATASGTKAPSFTINLGASTSYDLGNTTVTIDFSWYDTYKPTVDLLFAAIIWAGFLWRMYSRIPEILNGVGMTVVMPYQIQHMEMEKDRRDLTRARSDARWDAWIRRRDK